MASSVSSTRALYIPSTNAFEHTERLERQPKRLRLSDDLFATFQTQSAREDVALEVDHIILDYTAGQAIKACLASRNNHSSATSLSACLSMVNSFLPIFKARHPSYTADPELKFRIKLLKLVTLFTQRFTRNPATPQEAALDALRESNKKRALEWIQRTEDVPSSRLSVEIFDDFFPRPSQELESNRSHVLQELDIPAEDRDSEEPFYGTSSCIPLLDILPLFMEVSASRNAMNASNLSEEGMHMAAEFMLQACLEQYLIVGAEGSDAIDMAFSWGYSSNTGNEEQAETEMNDMFEDEEYAKEVVGWSEIKMSYLEALLPPDHGDANVSTNEFFLEKVAAKFPIDKFESSILEYLEALSKSISEPVLLQLESGKLDGMTEQETQDFISGCGVDVARLFQG
jgi:hypothetical protein